MNIELLPGLTNVIRFPLEQRVRPSILLVHEIAPDIREVLLIAEAFQLDGFEPGLEEAADRETAAHIAEQLLPAAPTELKPALAALLDPVVERAVEACRQAHGASVQAVEAQQTLHWAKTERGSWLQPLEERAEVLTRRAAQLLLLAYARCQEAWGVDRAVGFARRGETWQPRSADDAGDWLAGVDQTEKPAA